MRKLAGVLMGAVLLVGMAGPASAQSGTHQRFVLISTSENAPQRVVAGGVINGAGTDVVLSSTDNPDGTSSGVDRFEFPRGSVTIAHQDTSATSSFDPRACVGRFSGTGDFQILGGTGIYAGITGSGTYTLRGTFVANRNPDGSCAENGSGRSVVIVNATGPIAVGGSTAAA